MTGNRTKKRFARRLQVRFWKQGEERASSAYTTNISAAGMFIGTGSPLARGSRLRIEVLDLERSFVLEGVVVHAARGSPSLKKLKESGMGVRFLGVEELVAEILPSADVTEEEPQRPAPAGAEPGTSREAEPPTASPPPEGARASPDESGTPPPPGEPDTARPPSPAAATHADRTYRMRFSSLPDFLSIYERDIRNGGVFVPTQNPAPLHQRISIEIHVPAPVGQAARFPGRVVQVIAPQPEARNLLAGMGVEFIDPERVVQRLDSLIYAD